VFSTKRTRIVSQLSGRVQRAAHLTLRTPTTRLQDLVVLLSAQYQTQSWLVLRAVLRTVRVLPFRGEKKDRKWEPDDENSFFRVLGRAVGRYPSDPTKQKSILPLLTKQYVQRKQIEQNKQQKW
jgi:hypothetical protein